MSIMVAMVKVYPGSLVPETRITKGLRRASTHPSCVSILLSGLLFKALVSMSMLVVPWHIYPSTCGWRINNFTQTGPE